MGKLDNATVPLAWLGRKAGLDPMHCGSFLPGIGQRTTHPKVFFSLAGDRLVCNRARLASRSGLYSFLSFKPSPFLFLCLFSSTPVAAEYTPLVQRSCSGCRAATSTTMNATRECCPTPPQPSEPSSRPAVIPAEVRRRPLENHDTRVCLDASRKQQFRIHGGKYCRSFSSRLLRSFTFCSWIMVVFLLWAVSLDVVAGGSVDIVPENDMQGRDNNVEMVHARDGVDILLDHDLHRRSASASKTDDLPSSIVAPTGTMPTVSATSTGIASDSGNDDTTNPSPFDGVSLTTNFTAASCPAFFQTFLKDPLFTGCLPLSMLLQTSDSFFSITEKGSLATTKIIDLTCNVQNVTACQETMEKYGWMIRQDSHCGADYKAGNPIVQQAFDGFISYNIVYTAGCQKSDSGSYCYVDAITNTASPSDSYIYYLPLGLSLPGGSRPSCNTCLTTTMAAFDTVAGNATQPLSKTYAPAAEQINLGCGPNFVNATVQPLSSHAPSPSTSSSTFLVLTITLALVGQYLL